MKGFAGFPEGPVRMTPMPATFFTDLLPIIDHLGELKLTLYMLWRFSQQEGAHRFLALSELRKRIRTARRAERGGPQRGAGSLRCARTGRRARHPVGGALRG